MSNIFYGQY